MTALILAACLLQQRVQTDAGCIKCHEGQPDDWKGSVHEKNGVGCVRCHGADSVSDQSKPHLFTAGFRRGTKKTNATLCAECHKREFEAFDRSAHAEDTRDDSGNVKGCKSCHEFHSTAPADRRAILKEYCAKCHRAGSVPLKLGEEYAAFADGLPAGGPALTAARVAQHGASAARYQEIRKEAAAYNTRDEASPRAVVAAAAAALGAALAWVLRGKGRPAS